MSASPALDIPAALDDDTDTRVDLAEFLVGEGWPQAAILAHAVGLLAEAVKRKYIEVHGEEPPRDRGPVYSGYSDWLLVRDVWAAEGGAIAERLAFEGMGIVDDFPCCAAPMPARRHVVLLELDR